MSWSSIAREGEQVAVDRLKNERVQQVEQEKQRLARITEERKQSRINARKMREMKRVERMKKAERKRKEDNEVEWYGMVSRQTYKLWFGDN